MPNARHAGILLHPTSLPGPHGIGDIGPAAHAFVQWLHDAGFSHWQVLPLGPTGYGDSPYQCFSAFAGNPFLISLELLAKDGLLDKADLRAPAFPKDNVDFGWVIDWKMKVLHTAFDNLARRKSSPVHKRIAAFRRRKGVRAWLDDFALFMALKKQHGGASWNTWSPALRTRDDKALAKARRDLADDIAFHTFLQATFFHQWEALRAAAHKLGIRIVGDIPIYVAYDSADTWAHQDLFKLHKDGTPTHVAGVPPDYFSATGQLWGNPIYRYDRMEKTGFAWWIERVRATLEQVDVIRLDHFRGFEAYWEVPYGEPTAINGVWKPGPGAALFEALAKALGSPLPIIAENLGVITPPVEELRHQYALPGMKVLQFGWGTVAIKPLVPDPENVFAPHLAETDSVVYTGTHDNPTTTQWWEEFASPGERALLEAYAGQPVTQPAETLMQLALSTSSSLVLFPMQDVLGLGGEARMNYPGRESGNWTWRLSAKALSKPLARTWNDRLLVYARHARQDTIASAHLARQTAAQRARKP